MPYLNDFLIETFGINFFNVKLCDFKNYFEIFEKFKNPINKFYNPKENALNQYLRLNYTYLSFLDHKDFSEIHGISEENSLIFVTITGKSKVNNI